MQLWSAVTCHRFVQATCRRRTSGSASLPKTTGRWTRPRWPTSRPAGKAATSRRTPKRRERLPPFHLFMATCRHIFLAKCTFGLQTRGIGPLICPGGSLIRRRDGLICPGGSLICRGGKLTRPGGSLIRPGGSLICPGSSLIRPGGGLICPGGSLICRRGH